MFFRKFEGNPILGSAELGTCFDVYVQKLGGRYRMDFSWRTHECLAVTFSDDGIHWEEPQVTLRPEPDTGWQERLNRNCVLFHDGIYKMWYTGQARGHSFIGYAESTDGIRFENRSPEPVLISEFPFEGESVMNPCVLIENGVYRMWYSAGETFEPNVMCYAESADGITWKKFRINPVMVHGSKVYERNRIGGCQVMKTEDMGYVMFYIGYTDIHTACICAARSENGITGWKRSEKNPMVFPTEGSWDADSCYKPSFLWREDENRWYVYYNGRLGHCEYIGCAFSDGRELF